MIKNGVDLLHTERSLFILLLISVIIYSHVAILAKSNHVIWRLRLLWSGEWLTCKFESRTYNTNLLCKP